MISPGHTKHALRGTHVHVSSLLRVDMMQDEDQAKCIPLLWVCNVCTGSHIVQGC